MMKKLPLMLLCWLATSAQANPVAPAGVQLRSLEAAGRNIMRTADGGMVASFVKTVHGQAELIFSTSSDNGKRWQETVVVKGGALQTAMDSNFQGTYIAFIEEVNGKKTGRIGYTPSPFAANRRFVLSGSVTPVGVEAKDTFIQASRLGWGEKGDENAQTVAYGWQDAHTKALYIGVSMDGKTFPLAQKVIDDPFASSGPSVGIRGNYVFATWLTQNPVFAPQDIPAKDRAGRSYQAWTESRDGGVTWRKPQSLFGMVSTAYPLLPQLGGSVAKPDAVGIFLDGGTDGPIASSLVWDASGKGSQTGGIVFVQSELAVRGNEKNKVGVVSFKPLAPDGQWTHVLANKQLAAHSVTGQFQYSALIDTPVRASVYHEMSGAHAHMVIVASVDTGKVFDRYLRLSAADLKQYGIARFDQSTKFETSQCLFEDRAGNVYVDLLVFNGANGLEYARIPLNVNTKIMGAEASQKLVLAQ